MIQGVADHSGWNNNIASYMYQNSIKIKTLFRPCMTYHICVSNVATYATTQTADVISDVPISKIKTNFCKEGEK